MRRTVVISLVLVILDQAIKLLADGFLRGQPPQPVIDGFFYLTLVYNKGIAFGFFPQYSRLFVFLSLATIAAIVLLYRKVFSQGMAYQTAGGLILGGAVGNLLDRIIYGHVIDFFDFRLGTYRWPAFNLADSAICVGVGLLLVMVWSTRKKEF